VCYGKLYNFANDTAHPDRLDWKTRDGEMSMPITKFKLCLLAVSIIAAGCATQPSTARVANANAGSDVQCHSEQLTGSLITRSVCTTKEQRDAMQAEAENIRSHIQQPGDPCRPGAGC
jgi:hypothetical protein